MLATSDLFDDVRARFPALPGVTWVDPPDLAPPQPSAAGYRLAGDCPTALQAARRALEGDGYTAAVAADGLSLSARRPDGGFAVIAGPRAGGCTLNIWPLGSLALSGDLAGAGWADLACVEWPAPGAAPASGQRLFMLAAAGLPGNDGRPLAALLLAERYLGDGTYPLAAVPVVAGVPVPADAGAGRAALAPFAGPVAAQTRAELFARMLAVPGALDAVVRGRGTLTVLDGGRRGRFALGGVSGSWACPLVISVPGLLAQPTATAMPTVAATPSDVPAAPTP
jgi:hypothetical protein